MDLTNGVPPIDKQLNGNHVNGEHLNGENLSNDQWHPDDPIRGVVNGHAPEGRSRGLMGLNNTYDELYRQQNGGSDQSEMLNVVQAPTALRPNRPSPLMRARSDFGPRNKSKTATAETDDELLHMRHGWENEYTSNEYLSLLNSAFYLYYTDKRHDTSGIPKMSADAWSNADWRMKDRLKTVSAALAICLNLGVDPPDVIKTSPCAKLESWVDPTATTGGSTKTMEQIGKKLQEQYETLSLRTRYKQYLDPSIEETKRFCVSLRRNAKDERVLFHYNGHGVPLPTASGELWVFNKNYTQYIPIGVYDLQSWLAGPSLFVYDVSHAGNIIHNFAHFQDKHEKENKELRSRDPNAAIQNYGDCIQLAACGRNENLPTNPNLPADLFTCCLTTPIDIALRFFVLQNPLPSSVKIDDGKIPVPGKLQDRRSPLGELNWIFTAITDTIAWNILPRALFKKLFRQDLMVAALFRNFLLSERIMRANNCHPISSPELPETHHHPLWQSWDLSVETVLAQLPALVEHEEGKRIYEYQHSHFFTEQLTAFEVYLSSGPTEEHAPDQLPIVLQVLLSQAHRLRALILLSKFLDLGPWAVHLALSIGIFPYVVKLLQSAAQELKPVMIFIWARIMAVDYTVQSDLLKDNGIHYFISIINPSAGIAVVDAGEHRAMCSFIVAIFCRNYPQGQNLCRSHELVEACLRNAVESDNPLLRQWSCLCLSSLWFDFPDAKWMGIRCAAHVKLCDLAVDPVPEVRASMLHALTSFIGIPDLTDQIAQIEENIAQTVLFLVSDGSVLVRKELLVFFSSFVKRYENKFTVAAYEQMLEEREHLSERNILNGETQQSTKLTSLSGASIFGSMWKQCLIMSMDSHPEVAQHASIIIDYVHEVLVNSPMGSIALPVMEDILRLSRRQAKKVPPGEKFETVSTPLDAPNPDKPQLKKQNSSFFASLRGVKSVLWGSGSQEDTNSGLEHMVNDTSSQKPHIPPKPQNTPRGRMPAEWSRPPDANEGDTKLLTGNYRQAYIPSSPGYNAELSSDRPVIPLKSTLLEWSTEYFREPQMKSNEPDEPGSSEYNQRLWRRTRNERIISDNQPLKEKAGASKWDRVEAFLNNQIQPTKLAFHQFEDHLAVAGNRDTITIWDFTHNVRLSRFSNSNPPTTRINTLRFINEDDSALLLTGSSDGIVKVYRNYSHPAPLDPENQNNKRRLQPSSIRPSSSDTKSTYPEIVTSFTALTELLPSNRTAGLVLEWQQGRGTALCAGDTRTIRAWNAATEQITSEIPARSSSCVTSLTSDQVAGQIFVAGFGDGVVRVFDQRLNPRTSMVRCWREHKQWVTGVHMQRGGVRELVSGSRNGEVRLWDLREDKPVLSLDATTEARTYSSATPSPSHVSTMRSLSVHEHAPVLAVGSDKHEIRSYNTSDGRFLGAYEPLAGSKWAAAGAAVAGGVGAGRNRNNAIVATAYHPHKMILAVAGLGDGHVTVLGI